MITRRTLAWGAMSVALAGCAPAQAKTERSRSIDVRHVWSRPTARSSLTGIVYMEIRNTGSDEATVTGIEVEVAARAEIHRTVRTGDVGRLDMVGPLLVAAGETVGLKPGGLHVMLSELKSQLVIGRGFPARLILDDGSLIAIDVAVLARTPPQPGLH